MPGLTNGVGPNNKNIPLECPEYGRECDLFHKPPELYDCENENYRGGFVAMTILPNPRTHQNQRIPWQAELYVFTKDISERMRRGIHWSEENVLKPENIIKTGSAVMPECQRNFGWDIARRYTLKHQSHNPQWRAILWVYSNKTIMLRDFRVRDLESHNVVAARALNKASDLVYCFDRFSPDECFNAIYDDMPMEG